MKLEKNCPRCKVFVAKTLFGNNRLNKDGLNTYCKPCAHAMKKRYCQEQPERVKAWKQRDYQKNRDNYLNRERRKAYNISAAQYKAMLIEQDNKCAICNREERSIRNGKQQQLAVDHCHEIGSIRALLCMSCNNGLGRFGHNPDFLIAAAHYLNKYKK